MEFDELCYDSFVLFVPFVVKKANVHTMTTEEVLPKAG
jgi:hypothetical protein